MAYAILRTAKLKSFGEIGGSLAHTFRDRETPNADPTRTPANEHWGPETSADVQRAIREVLPEKRRSDAVLCIEYFIGRSPNWDGDDGAYFSQAVDWLVDRHGRDNVISAHVHRDETTPHLVAYVVPRDGERLNAKKWLGGRAVLSAMQTDFWERVGRQHGLERGEEGSVAQHQTIKTYYAAVERAQEAVQAVQIPTERQVLEKGLLSTTYEGDEAFAKRVGNAVRDQLMPAAQKGAEAVQIARRERQQAQEVERLRKELSTAKGHQARLESIFQGLGPGQVEQLMGALQRAADQMRDAARVVVGWFQSLGQERLGEDWVVTVKERSTGETVKLQAHKAAMQLDDAGAKVGDLVEVGPGGGRILERSNARLQQKGLER